MKESFKNNSSIVGQKLSLVESLIQQKDFKQALAELRDLENQKEFVKLTDESGEFYYLFSLVLQGLGNYEEALIKAKESFEILRNSSENEKLAKVQFISGIIYSDLGDLKRSELELRDALAIYRRIKNYEGIIESYNELARIHFVRTEYDKGIEHLKEGLSFCERMKDDKRIARFCGNLGRIYLRTGKWKEAKENLFRSLESNKLNNNLVNICCCYLSLGYLSYLLRDFSQSTKYLEKALKLIFENNYTREFAIYHEYSGELQFARSNYEKAKNHYLDAIGIGEEIAPESGIVSQTYRLLAELQIVEKQYDEAFSSCQKALKVAESLGEKIEIGAIHRALGQIYTAKSAGVVGELARHELAKAKESFEKSISILEQIGAKFELGKSYLEATKSNAFEYFDRVANFANAREVFKELESDYWLGKVTLAFCKMLFQNGEYEKAEVYLKDAEKTFKRLNEKRDLDSLLELKEKTSRILGKEECAGESKAKYTFSNIITKNKEILRIIEEIQKAKDSDLPILLEGETGTGKDLFAKTIHYQSKRRGKRFVSVNCSALPDTLLENELFGHKRGAYTGADKDESGLFEEAEGGTFYFDEIGEVPLSTQVKLLRVIEEKEVTRLGETRPRKVDVRIIASSSRNLKKMVLEESFRKDLYHRLNIFSFRLSPLRERKEDMPSLIEYFLRENQVYEKFSAIFGDAKVMAEFLDYDWPGNVRELKHEIERLAISTTDIEKITSPLLLERIINLKNGDSKKAPGSLFDEVAEFEKKKIIQALKEANGMKNKAANVLNIPVNTLLYKIKKYNL